MEVSGFSSPHPLLMSFPTETPVYPMKLTALVKQCIFPLFGICIFTSLIIFVALPKIKVTRSKHRIFAESDQRKMIENGSKYLFKQPGFLTNETKVIEQKLIDYFEKESFKNVFTGEPIQVEDSPGNFTIIRNNQEIELQTYSIDGTPIKEKIEF